MSAIKRDLYSNLKFFQAIVPQDVVTTLTGETIDLRGYDGCVFAVNCGAATGGGAWAADDFFQLKLEHALASANGVSVWSECYPSQMIHSVIGMAGAYSALNSGIFQSITSTDDLSADTGKMFVVGYKGPRRYVRIYVSAENTPSTMSIGATAVLGLLSDWPAEESQGD